MEAITETRAPVRPRVAYTVEGAAEAAGVGRTSIFSEIKAGRLKAKKFGKRTLITDEALREWLATLAPAQ